MATQVLELVRVQGTRFLTKTSAVAEQLRNDILHGVLRPGTQLEQDELASRFGMSITPVREAFSVLQAEGLLELRPHRGVIVASLDYRDASDLYAIRRMLEVMAIRRAVPNIDDDMLQRLELANKSVEVAARHSEVHQFRELCAQFHEVILEATGSKIYSDTTRSIIHLALFAVPLDERRIDQVISEHRAIIRALRARDGKKAAQLMDRHLGGSERMLHRNPSAAKKQAPTRPIPLAKSRARRV
jgi:DNA-binding GntR family transcriptional regulator